MNDPDAEAMKKLVFQALENCHDADLLDLIYKMLIFEILEQ